jgi:ABC-type multidrug transport system fused ATPase/permease subunit
LFFAPTINDNIAHGKDGAPIEEIRAAVELTNAVILLLGNLGW